MSWVITPPPKSNYPDLPGNHLQRRPPVAQNRTFRCLTRSAWGVIGGSQVADSGFTNLSARSLGVLKDKSTKEAFPGDRSSPHLTRGELPKKNKQHESLMKENVPFLSTKKRIISFIHERDVFSTFMGGSELNWWCFTLQVDHYLGQLTKLNREGI